MPPRSYNPLLPKAPTIRWRKGPFAETPDQEQRGGGINPPSLENETNSAADDHVANARDITARTKAAPRRAYPDAGKLSFDTGAFFNESNSGWGGNLDMIPLAHGPVGCGAFAQTSRLNMPGFEQGVDSFTALDAGTNFSDVDFEDGGDAKLARALDEAKVLFPLAGGITILREDPLALFDTNIKGIARTKTKELERLIVSAPSDVAGEAAALKTAAKLQHSVRDNSYDVAIPFYRGATGLVWIVAKLLHDIGLYPVLEFTGSSTSDMGRISQCKLAISFFDNLDDPADSHRGYPRLLRQWYGMPLVSACFLGPSATGASLRAIASHFDAEIQHCAETIIESNRKKIDAVVAKYRPRLQNKLVLLLHGLPKTHLEIFQLLGMRIGNCDGWPGKRGVRRTPRLVIDENNIAEKALASYVAEAKPDLIYHMAYDEHDWRKRGIPSLAFASPFMDHGLNLCWGYDGFACFAAELDRALNAPWRKLSKPPWPTASG